MKKDIHIKIYGLPNTGKTSVAMLIRDTLTKHGFECSINDIDLDLGYIPDCGKTIPVIAKNVDVHIETLQLRTFYTDTKE